MANAQSGYWSNMTGDAILAVLGLMCLLAVALTGAVWDTPIVTVPVRWFMS